MDAKPTAFPSEVRKSHLRSEKSQTTDRSASNASFKSYEASTQGLSNGKTEGALASGAISAATETFHRTRSETPEPAADLTPEQLLLDAQLRAWRKSEAERIGLPQFFVLGSSALLSIVLQRPRTIAQLQTISGIGPEKAEKFGATIVNICSA